MVVGGWTGPRTNSEALKIGWVSLDDAYCCRFGASGAAGVEGVVAVSADCKRKRDLGIDRNNL